MESEATKEIKKKYGETAIFLLSQFPKVDVRAISTSSLLLDYAIGVGGIPLGRVSEVFGEDGSGKTTLMQHLVANAQKENIACAFIDVENAIDPKYAKACGVDFNTLYLSQPNSAEEALDIAEILVKSGEFGLIVIDSLAALSPESERGEEFNDTNTAGMLRAKLLKVFFRRCMPLIRKNNVAVVFTNQLIDNTKSKWGGSKPVGGWGIKYYASVRIDLGQKFKGEVFSGDERVGQEIEFVVVKNRVAPPFKTGTFNIIFGLGVDRETDILSTAEILGIVKKRGAYYTLDGETLAQGKVKTVKKLKELPELTEELGNRCKEELADARTRTGNNDGEAL